MIKDEDLEKFYKEYCRARKEMLDNFANMQDELIDSDLDGDEEPDDD